MALKIVIVEDVHAIAQMYKLKLEVLGYEAHVAENGKVGLRLVEEVKPDLVLLDLMMPQMSGDEMLKLMREKSWGKDIRVIMLSNVSQEEMPPILGTLNVDRFIMKADYTPSQIAGLVAETINNK